MPYGYTFSYFDRPTEYVPPNAEAVKPESNDLFFSGHSSSAKVEPNAIEVTEDGRRFLVALTSQQIESAQVCQQQTNK